MRARVIAVLLVTALCLGVALWGINLDEAAAALSSMALWRLLPMFGMYLVTHSLRSWRLGLLLGQPVPFGRLFAINTIGFLAINVIPLRLGEAVRPYLLSERQGVPLPRAIAAILLERLLDMLMLLVWLLGLTLLIDLPAEGIVVKGINVLEAGQRIAGLFVVAGLCGVAGIVLFGEGVVGLLGRLPMGARLVEPVRRFRAAFVELLAHPARAAGLLGLTATIWGLTTFAVSIVMSAFPGIPVSVGSAVSTWAITISGMTAIPTPGFFGAYELFCTAALWLWGVDADLARTFAIVLHLGQLGFIVLVGGVMLVVEGMSLRDLVRPAA